MLDYWQCELVYSESGRAEENCIFLTQFPAMGEAVWVVSRYEREPYLIEFVLTCPQTHVEQIAIALEPLEGGATTVHWRRAYVGLNDQGNQLIQELSGEHFTQKMTYLAATFDYYLKTGEKLLRHPD
jgi:hypothetical protein